MLKKILVSVMCMMLGTTALWGCAGDTGNETQSEAASGEGDAAAESTQAAGEPVEIKLRSGATSGSWYPATAAMAKFLPEDIPGLTVTVTPGSGPANVQAIQDGVCDIAFGKMPSTMQGMRGEEPFKEVTDQVTYMLYLYDETFHLVVPADSGIESVEDLKGKILTTQTTGNLAEQMMRELLSVYGMSYDDLKRVNMVGYEDSVQQMKDGAADAFAFATAVPASVLVDLCSARDMKILEIPDDKLEAMKEINDGYMEKVIPAGSYEGQDEDVQSFGGAIHMMARKDLPEDLVYEITKSIFENVDKLGEAHSVYQGLTPEIMGAPTSIPFHPGTEKYLKEIGVLE